MMRADARSHGGPGRRRWRRDARGLGLLLLMLLVPRPALAHARLRRSDPKDGVTVVMPRVIRLWFTEEPELSLTVVRLSDSSGAVVAVGAPVHDRDGPLSVRLPIQGTMHPGRYTVAWSTAAMDGHPSSGRFSFRVEASSAGAAAPAIAVASTDSPAPALIVHDAGPTPAQTPDASALTPPYVAARALSFVALLALIGAVTFRMAVLPRVPPGGGDVRSRTLAALGSGAAGAAGAYLVAAALRLALQDRMMTGDALTDTAHMRSMAMETHWGAVWRLQLVAGVVALVGALLARRRIAAGWALTALASVALALGTALGGHAATSESARTLAVIDDALHVVGAAGWLGSLLWLAAVALPILYHAEGARAQHVAALVRAFSPTALAFAGLVALTGVVSAWLRLGSIATLWTTSYGQVLLLKLALLAGVAATGFYNWRYVQPALGTDAATARLARSARIELAVGLLVLLATAVLVAMPTPAPPAS